MSEYDEVVEKRDRARAEYEADPTNENYRRTMALSAEARYRRGPSVEQMIEEILEAVPDSEIVIGKGAASVLVYPPPHRHEERLWTETGDARECVAALYNRAKKGGGG